jgi:hypothetical protein
MAKKNKKQKETTIENFYDLKSDQIDDLVETLKEENVLPEGSNAEEISYRIADYVGEENVKGKNKNKKFDPYRMDKFSRIPTWVKAFFVKFWAAGMVCFLFLWGIQSVITDDTFALALIDGVIMGIVTDVFVNTGFQHFQSDAREYDPYMMFPFPFKKFWTFFANIIYYVIVNIIVFLICNLIGNFIYSGFGLDPILFGIFNLVVDMFFIGIKDLFVFIFRKLRKKKEITQDV